MRAVSLSTIGQFVTDAGSDRLRTAPGFGIRPDGSAYFDPDGALAGQAAYLRLSPAGRLTLSGLDAAGLTLAGPGVGPRVSGETRPAADTATRRPSLQPRAPMSASSPPVVADLREGRPVELAGAVTGELIDGRPVAQPDAASAQLRTGRPVGVAEPVTLAVRQGRPVALPGRRRIAVPGQPQPQPGGSA